MDTKRHELLTILGQAMAEAVDLHERQEAAGLDPLQRAGKSSRCWSGPPIKSRTGRGPRAHRGTTHRT